MFILKLEKLSKYLYIEYQTNMLCYPNEEKYFSIDECNIISINNKSIWLLGIINNNTKNFRIEPVINRDADTIKTFLTKYVGSGNRIVIDGWSGYDFLDHPLSGYRRYKHIHGRSDFGYGVPSTSHIENIWAQIQSKLKDFTIAFLIKIL